MLDVNRVQLNVPLLFEENHSAQGTEVREMNRALLLPLTLYCICYACNFIYAFDMPKNTNKKQAIIDLQMQHDKLTPREKMDQIASACEALNINEFDVYGDYDKDEKTSFLRNFERDVAKDFNKEDAVFMPSGVMAQSIALLIHSSGVTAQSSPSCPSSLPFRFACHHTSHLLLWEENAYEKLLNMDVTEICTKDSKHENGVHVPPMHYEDVSKCFKNEKEKQLKGEEGRLSTLIIELPHRELGGKLTPWKDVLGIGQLCKEEGVKFHCDGARIFEASAGYDMNLSEIASIFDSVYISFYKGLGSISGAMLMGNKDFCSEARTWLRRFGGNMYTLMPYAADSWKSYKKYANVQIFQRRLEKLQCLTKRLESEITHFTDFVKFDPPTPETNMIHVYFSASVAECEKARDLVLKEHGVSIFTRLREIPSSDSLSQKGFGARFEWTIGDANGSIDNEVFISSWDLFINKLQDCQLKQPKKL